MALHRISDNSLQLRTEPGMLSVMHESHSSPPSGPNSASKQSSKYPSTAPQNPLRVVGANVAVGPKVGNRVVVGPNVGVGPNVPPVVDGDGPSVPEPGADRVGEAVVATWVGEALEDGASVGSTDGTSDGGKDADGCGDEDGTLWRSSRRGVRSGCRKFVSANIHNPRIIFVLVVDLTSRWLVARGRRRRSGR